MDYKSQYKIYLEKINEALSEYVPQKDDLTKTVFEAMRYSLLAGGKRLRPVLALAVSDMLGGEQNEVMPYACAVEMIHTYSLIHDDLPAMDNDDYRRGRLTNHKVYGEALAILAGDGLLNLASETMVKAMLKDTTNIHKKAQAMNEVSTASGVYGMIGGQVIDLESEGKKIEIDTLKKMHLMKTGALIKAPVLSAARVCSANDQEIEQLTIFAENLGLAFQIKDDILDVEGDSQVLGKNVGSDALNEKSTYVTLFGLEESKRLLEEVSQRAISSLDIFGEKASFLVALTKEMVTRVN